MSKEEHVSVDSVLLKKSIMSDILDAVPLNEDAYAEKFNTVNIVLGNDPYVSNVQRGITLVLLLIMLLAVLRLFYNMKQILVPKRRMK